MKKGKKTLLQLRLEVDLLLLGTEDVDEEMGSLNSSESSDSIEETIITGDISSLSVLAG